MINIKTLLGLNTYISETDLFLAELKQHQRLSASQQFEKEKYKRISEFRDQVKVQKDKKTFWENF